MEHVRNLYSTSLPKKKVLQFSAGLLLVLVVLLMILISFKVVIKSPPEYNQMPEGEVPNIVHFIRFGNKNVTFIEAVCMLAALKHQKPDKLYVHTDSTQKEPGWGQYWDVVVESPEAEGVIELKYLPMRTTIKGRQIMPSYLFQHAADYERIRILIKYGGIYLDGDSYIVKDLSEFFKYEMTVGWKGEEVFNQVLIAKRNSRFLRLWRDSYFDYRPERWYYNGGHLPGRMIKMVPSQWVHTVPRFLAEYSAYINRMLYYWDTGVWKQHYAIHLLQNHQYMLKNDTLELFNVTYPVVFDENNILRYPINIRQMALDVYPYNQTVMDTFTEIYPHLPREKDVPILNEYKSATQSDIQIQYMHSLIEKIKNEEA